MKTMTFSINQGWQVFLKKVGINTRELLRRSELPDDLFTRRNVGLNPAQYFRLWTIMEQISESDFAVKLVQTINADVFDPPIFAAYCSPNLNTALQRLSKFKPLIGPMILNVDIKDDKTQLVLNYLNQNGTVPTLLIATEIGFFIQLSRLAIREHVVPTQIIAPVNLDHLEGYQEFLGIAPFQGPKISLSFSAKDATKPFISENIQMWDFFEPSLRKRLAEIGVKEKFSERAHSALLEMLPSGETTADDLAKKLLISKTTLQRRLGDEVTNFKEVLINVRKKLAKYYIRQSELPYTQISFLLGYEDPNSFFRAFNTWTGSTPDTYRSQA